MTHLFPCTDEAMAYLSRRDAKMRDFIAEVGRIDREVEPDAFAALVSSIVSQQISTKAADTILERMTRTIGKIEPEAILALSEGEIRSFGMTHRKASYIRAAAERADIVKNIREMSDADAVRALCDIPGVGVWTAEMMLIFSLCRPDVLSFGDLGIRRGMSALYGVEIDRRFFERKRARYSPFGSTASLYIWEAAHRAQAKKQKTKREVKG